MVAKSASFICVLTRVPEAYALVRRYGATRPGFLFLDANGESWGSVSLMPGEAADVVAARVVAAMNLVLAGTKLPNAGEPGYIGFESDFVGDSGVPGAPPAADAAVRLNVRTVVADSPATAAGLRVGDVILALSGRRMYGRYDAVLPAFDAWRATVRRGEPVQLVIERGHEVRVLDVTPAARPATAGRSVVAVRQPVPVIGNADPAALFRKPGRRWVVQTRIRLATDPDKWNVLYIGHTVTDVSETGCTVRSADIASPDSTETATGTSPRTVTHSFGSFQAVPSDDARRETITVQAGEFDCIVVDDPTAGTRTWWSIRIPGLVVRTTDSRRHMSTELVRLVNPE